MKFDLLVTDIDRTFSDHNKNIFPENIDYLKYLKQQGVILVANTGRGLKSGKFILDLNIFDYFIGNDGAFIYDAKSNKVIFHKSLAKEKVNDVLKIANKYKIPWVIEANDNIYFSDVPETHKKEFLSYSTYPYQYTNYINSDANRVLMMLTTINAKKFLAEFPDFPHNFDNLFNCFYNERSLELTHKNVSKGKTLLWLLKLLKIDPQKILAIGDSTNDISMLKLTMMSIAMQGADEPVLKVAKYITTTLEKNGWLQGVKYFENK